MSFRLYVCHAIPFPIDGDVEILCKNNKKYQEKQKNRRIILSSSRSLKKGFPRLGGSLFLCECSVLPDYFFSS